MALILSGDTGPSFVQSAAQPAGSVLQVVNFTTRTQTDSTNGTYVSTPVTATITPKFATSKILVLVSGNSFANSASSQISLQLYRNGSDLNGILCQSYSPSAGVESYAGFVYLDSPATTSSTVYRVYMANTTSTGTVSFPVNTAAAIFLMEIAV